MTDHAAALIARHFGVAEGELCIGGIRVSTIAEQYKTPLFVYDPGIIDRKLAQLRAALPPQFAISYSVKANPNRTLLKHLLAQGCGLEIASAGEYHAAIDAGCPADHILFAGPGKTEAELELVLAKGIGEIHVESLTEIRRILAISRRLGVRADLAVRVNPTAEIQGGAMRMGGKPAPFGVDEESLDLIVDAILAEPSLILQGIHLFSGTQILDHTILIGQYRKGLEIARRLADRLGRPLKTVDLGGGLGIPYFPNERELDMEMLREGLAGLMTETTGDRLFAGTRFMVEPGRYLIGEAGVYVARVNDIKVSRGKKFLILDGGMNHHLAASGNLGQAIKRNFPIAVLNRLDRIPRETVDVVGPLCTPLDTLARNVDLPAAEIGDLVGIFQSGAYALTASPVEFLSHPSPPEVLVEGDGAFCMRPRGSMRN